MDVRASVIADEAMVEPFVSSLFISIFSRCSAKREDRREDISNYDRTCPSATVLKTKNLAIYETLSPLDGKKSNTLQITRGQIEKSYLRERNINILLSTLARDETSDDSSILMRQMRR